MHPRTLPWLCQSMRTRHNVQHCPTRVPLCVFLKFQMMHCKLGSMHSCAHISIVSLIGSPLNNFSVPHEHYDILGLVGGRLGSNLGQSPTWFGGGWALAQSTSSPVLCSTMVDVCCDPSHIENYTPYISCHVRSSHVCNHWCPIIYHCHHHRIIPCSHVTLATQRHAC